MLRWRRPFGLRDERPIGAIPRWVTAGFVALLAVQVGLRVVSPAPRAAAVDLEAPPPVPVLQVASLGEPAALAYGGALRLQAFDSQPGISLPYALLDYGRIERWLEALLALDPDKDVDGLHPLNMGRLAVNMPGPVPCTPAGIEAKARLIVVAPCCHQEVRPQLAHPEPLTAVLQHGMLAERLAEWVTDGLRALLLEASGYDTQVFEFVSLEHTSKNKMILAIKRRTVKDSAAVREQIRALKAFYGIREQCLETLLAADQPAA